MLFTADHDEPRRILQKFIAAEINPFVDEWEKNDIFPAHELFKKLGDLGLLGFLYDTLKIGFVPGEAAMGFIPSFDGGDSVLLACGILGATVMPHVIYLHSALTQDRIRPRDDEEKQALLRFQRFDVTIAMGLAANYPLALASGMGLNAAVAFQLVAGMKLPWQAAMGVVVLAVNVDRDRARSGGKRRRTRARGSDLHLAVGHHERPEPGHRRAEPRSRDVVPPAVHREEIYGWDVRQGSQIGRAHV